MKAAIGVGLILMVLAFVLSVLAYPLERRAPGMSSAMWWAASDAAALAAACVFGGFLISLAHLKIDH